MPGHFSQALREKAPALTKLDFLFSSSAAGTGLTDVTKTLYNLMPQNAIVSSNPSPYDIFYIFSRFRTSMDHSAPVWGWAQAASYQIICLKFP